jgi:small subunit ribosomal protein S21
MAKVILKEGESLEEALRRFHQRVLREGILKELRRRGSYESPSEAKKRKKAAKRKMLDRAKVEGR